MDSSFFSDSFSFLFILSKSLFILLIFFLLNLALVLSDALVILSFKESIWDFKLSISFSKFLNFLFTLQSLFLLRLVVFLLKELLLIWVASAVHKFELAEATAVVCLDEEGIFFE